MRRSRRPRHVRHVLGLRVGPEVGVETGEGDSGLVNLPAISDIKVVTGHDVLNIERGAINNDLRFTRTGGHRRGNGVPTTGQPCCEVRECSQASKLLWCRGPFHDEAALTRADPCEGIAVAHHDALTALERHVVVVRHHPPKPDHRFNARREAKPLVQNGPGITRLPQHLQYRFARHTVSPPQPLR